MNSNAGVQVLFNIETQLVMQVFMYCCVSPPEKHNYMNTCITCCSVVKHTYMNNSNAGVDVVETHLHEQQ